MLLVPSYNKHNVEKAKTVLADTVIFFDFEAILEDQRELGRTTIKEFYAEQGPSFGDSERVLRINNLGSEDLKRFRISKRD